MDVTRGFIKDVKRVIVKLMHDTAPSLVASQVSKPKKHLDIQHGKKAVTPGNKANISSTSGKKRKHIEQKGLGGPSL